MQALSKELGLQEHVTFVGQLPHWRVSEYLAAMDVSVAPFQTTAQVYFSPIKVFESMAVGTAVIAPRVGQLAEIISPGATGLLYEGDSPLALAKVLERLDRAELQRLGQNASRLVLGQYTWRHNAERILEAISRLPLPAHQIVAA